MPANADSQQLPSEIDGPTFISLGSIPSKKAVLKSSKGQKIEKLCGRSEWQPRILYVTADKLLIVHPDQENQISDQIPLVIHNTVENFQNGTMFHFILQHEITSSDRTDDGPGDEVMWLINTEEKGYNNGRQVINLQILQMDANFICAWLESAVCF